MIKLYILLRQDLSNLNEQTFGFLFDLEKLKSSSDDCLRASCINLEACLKHGNHSDIIGEDLYFELSVLKMLCQTIVEDPSRC